MSAGTASAIAAAVGAFVALATLVRSMGEYVLQGRQKRAEALFTLRTRLKSDRRLVEILRWAQDDRAELKDVSYSERYELLGLFEEVALMVNSRLVKDEIAWYMFGYYALSVQNSNNFWHGIYRNDLYWSLFRNFAKRMDEVERDSGRKMDKHGDRAVAGRRRMKI